MLRVVDEVGEEDAKAVFRFIQQKHKIHPGMRTEQNQGKAEQKQGKTKVKQNSHSGTTPDKESWQTQGFK